MGVIGRVIGAVLKPIASLVAPRASRRSVAPQAQRAQQKRAAEARSAAVRREEQELAVTGRVSSAGRSLPIVYGPSVVPATIIYREAFRSLTGIPQATTPFGGGVDMSETRKGIANDGSGFTNTGSGAYDYLMEYGALAAWDTIGAQYALFADGQSLHAADGITDFRAQYISPATFANFNTNSGFLGDAHAPATFEALVMALKQTRQFVERSQAMEEFAWTAFPNYEVFCYGKDRLIVPESDGSTSRLPAIGDTTFDSQQSTVRFTVAGTRTWTVPTGVTSINVEVVAGSGGGGGGGGGGAQAGGGGARGGRGGGGGGAGGDSSLSVGSTTLDAAGGSGGGGGGGGGAVGRSPGRGTDGGDGAGPEGGSGGTAGAPGPFGSNNPGQGGQGATGATSGTTGGNGGAGQAGGGGRGGNGGEAALPISRPGDGGGGGGGSAGERTTQTVSVTAGDTVTITVGSGGAGGARGTVPAFRNPGFPGTAGTAGAAGRVVITYSTTTVSRGATGTQQHDALTCLHDYLTDRRYGPNFLDIDHLSFFEHLPIARDPGLANNQTTFMRPSDSRVNQPIASYAYECGGSLSTDNTYLQNIGHLLDTLPGWLLFYGHDGLVKVAPWDENPNTETLSVMTITDDMIIGGIAEQTNALDNYLNVVQIKYRDISLDFAETSVTYAPRHLRVQDGTILEETAGVVLCYNERQARQIAADRLTISRKTGYSWQMVREGIRLEPGDIVRLQSDIFSLDIFIRVTDLVVDKDLYPTISGHAVRGDIVPVRYTAHGEPSQTGATSNDDLVRFEGHTMQFPARGLVRLSLAYDFGEAVGVTIIDETSVAEGERPARLWHFSWGAGEQADLREWTPDVPAGWSGTRTYAVSVSAPNFGDADLPDITIAFSGFTEPAMEVIPVPPDDA